MKNEPALISPPPDEVEAQLQALIAECHAIIRDVVVPAAKGVEDDAQRRRYLDSVVDLIRIANASGDTVARLRGHTPSTEQRQRIIVERVVTTGPRALPGGGG